MLRHNLSSKTHKHTSGRSVRGGSPRGGVAGQRCAAELQDRTIGPRKNQLFFSSNGTCRIRIRTYNRQVGSGRTARRLGGVAQKSSPRKDATLVPSEASRTRSLIIIVESKTRTFHGRVGSGRTAGRWGGVGQAGCLQNCSEAAGAEQWTEAILSL